ncbi:MAG TPA: polysaccharide deacetylase family protein [Candidatus Acidoferrales bacterium]|nr:polysaccharide deacetylase family protein [Candidatus Acidoferrales bacterium]
MNATLSLDLDNKWSYMMVHGDPGWDAFPSYLDLVVPRVLETLRAHKLKITVFIVGQDAALESSRDALASIAHDGHEIGNHSFHHRPWLHKRTRAEINEELAQSEEAISKATGRQTIGFRGPGYSRSPEILDVLAARGYLYDASPLSTWIGPLARAYYLRSTRLNASASAERDELFGGFSDGLGPNRRFATETPSGALTIVPVTTMPIVRIPIHMSYVLYLSAISPRLARSYARLSLAMCRLTGTEPSILLHPLDFIGGNDAPELRFFPGMQLAGDRKREVLNDVLGLLTRQFNVMRLADFVMEGRNSGAVSAA